MVWQIDRLLLRLCLLNQGHWCLFMGMVIQSIILYSILSLVIGKDDLLFY